MMAYLLPKNWYSDPIGTPARSATCSEVNDSKPTSTSSARAARRISSNRRRLRSCDGRRRGRNSAGSFAWLVMTEGYLR